MAVITPSTFDPLKARCNVRLQQGVPIVDSDWNELDDIRKFEMRAYLKWFVGDGIPDGTDGFRIDAISGSVDNFTIRAGNAAAPGGTSNTEIGLRYVGRCIVDGLDVIIPQDIAYKSQPLFAGPGPDGAPQIAPIPNAATPVTVYLDVWERLVTTQEDPSLVLPGIGTESCARTKREWCVRTSAGLAPPAPAPGHSHYALATIDRKMAGPNPAVITQADITDRRHKNLTVAKLENRLAKLEALLLVPVFAATNPLIPKSQAAGAEVTLTGRNFDVGTPVVTIGGQPAPLSGAFTANTIKVRVPSLPAPGPYPIVVTTDGGGPVTCPDQLTIAGGGGGGGPVPAPTLDAVNPFVPKSGKKLQGISVLGTNFDQPNLTVKFGANIATIQNSIATQISVQVPDILPGDYTVSVTTDGGTANSASTFKVNP
ncbi:IPT/TIG domain-containing protein [Sorangium sp. So ce1000]|uniref:IPT/TIG domain-containing protein n=1 Tax=Sorangium sp. So ce1000 TaxID=3133325 RepID=UPI003F5E9B7D